MMRMDYLTGIVSHPLWVCGLKSGTVQHLPAGRMVTPFMGVWIEICPYQAISSPFRVTPFMGVWIEILFCEKGST